MIEKDKAKELVDKMWIYALPNANGSWQNAKQCALIAVDEMIGVLIDLNGIYNITPALTYWQDVKQEIEKL